MEKRESDMEIQENQIMKKVVMTLVGEHGFCICLSCFFRLRYHSTLYAVAFHTQRIRHREGPEPEDHYDAVPAFYLF